MSYWFKRPHDAEFHFYKVTVAFCFHTKEVVFCSKKYDNESLFKSWIRSIKCIKSITFFGWSVFKVIRCEYYASYPLIRRFSCKKNSKVHTKIHDRPKVRWIILKVFIRIIDIVKFEFELSYIHIKTLDYFSNSNIEISRKNLGNYGKGKYSGEKPLSIPPPSAWLTLIFSLFFPALAEFSQRFRVHSITEITT